MLGLDPTIRSSRPEVFWWKGVMKTCSKFTGENPCQSAISIKLQSNFIEIALWHGCSPVNLLHIFRTSFLKNASGWLLLKFISFTNDWWQANHSRHPLLDEIFVRMDVENGLPVMSMRYFVFVIQYILQLGWNVTSFTDFLQFREDQ